MHAPSTADAAPAAARPLDSEHGGVGRDQATAGHHQEQRRQHGQHTEPGRRTTTTRIDGGHGRGRPDRRAAAGGPGTGEPGAR